MFSKKKPYDFLYLFLAGLLYALIQTLILLNESALIIILTIIIAMASGWGRYKNPKFMRVEPYMPEMNLMMSMIGVLTGCVAVGFFSLYGMDFLGILKANSVLETIILAWCLPLSVVVTCKIML